MDDKAETIKKPAEVLEDLKAAAEGKLKVEPVDLASLDPKVHMGVPTACALKHPITKADTGQRIWLFGKDSERVQDYLRGEADAKMAKQASRAAKGDDPEPMTIAQLEKQAIDLLVIATDRWENVYFKGETDAQFTVAKARELYAMDWVRVQLNKWIGELEHFMPG